MKRLFLSLVTVLISPIVGFAHGYDAWHPGGWGHMMDFGYGGMFMWIIFLILVVLVVYLILRSTGAKPSAGSFQETPLDILKRRYANGEITKEEFERMKRDLA